MNIPNVFSQPGSSNVLTCSSIPIEAPKTAPLKQGRFPRPQRNGRSQSMLDIPTIKDFKAPVQHKNEVSTPRTPGFTASSIKSDRLSSPPVSSTSIQPVRNALVLEPPSVDSRCYGCNLRLFSKGSGGSDITGANNIITLPSGEKFHARCFVCETCKKGFDGGIFVELEDSRRVHEKVGSFG